ncbi:UNVERIFIED_CONTAM: hypothetical protein Sradi_5651300 [Sesamum radiatum]|uniref:Uncharacterized protein n=1 Tax=Sesamum radiatum TaxID=300843 RepID=A0AAW2L2N0_SESRA
MYRYSSVQVQAPYNLRVAFQKEIQDAATEAVELVRCLGKDICNMQRSLKTLLLKRVHSSTARLQRAIDVHSYLLTSEPTDTSSKPQSTLSHALSSAFSNLSNHMAELDNKLLGQNPDPQSQPLDLYHETMRKQSRRLYSWLSREVDAFEEEGCFSSDCIPRMQALETTVPLSLATFTSFSSSLWLGSITWLKQLINSQRWLGSSLHRNKLYLLCSIVIDFRPQRWFPKNFPTMVSDSSLCCII